MPRRVGSKRVLSEKEIENELGKGSKEKKKVGIFQ